MPHDHVNAFACRMDWTHSYWGEAATGTISADRGTAQRAFLELKERGFIECMTKGTFSRKVMHATEWRLTWWSCDVTEELASKKFMSWGREKQNAVSKYPAAVSNQSHRAV